MRTRIVRLPVLAVAFALVLFGVPLAAGVLMYAMNDQRATLLRVADAAAAAVASDMVRGKLPTDLPLSGETNLAVYRDRGVRLVGTGPEGGDTQVQGALRGSISAGDLNGDLVVAVPVTHDSDVIGAVRASSSRAAIYRQAGLVWLAMLGLAGVTIGTVWFLARGQARRLMPSDVSATRVVSGEAGL